MPPFHLASTLNESIIYFVGKWEEEWGQCFSACPPRPLYSTSLKNDKMDVTDLVDLIRQAYTALDSWFSLIGQQDVDEAIQEIQLSG